MREESRDPETTRNEGTQMAQQADASLRKRLEELRAQLEERKASIPIHSVRPHQLIEIEELEEEIERLEAELEGG
jgi:hypothetical protein